MTAVPVGRSPLSERASRFRVTIKVREVEAARVTHDLRAQLDLIAQLNDRSDTKEIQLALEGSIVTSMSDPKLLARAKDSSR